MVDYSKWDALEVSSDDDDYVDKPNSKEAYRRIKARQRRESRDEAEKAARDAAVALNEELPSDREKAAAIARRQAAAAPRTATPRWRPDQSDPVPVKAPNDAAFAATFLEPADFKEKPVILPEPYEEWDFRISIPLESTCPYSWPEIDKTFAEHGEGAGLYVQDSRTFGPDCLIVHLAQFRWWLRSVEEAEFYWDDTLSVSKTEEDNDPELHMCCRRCHDFRGSPLRLDGADDSLVLRSQKYNNGCVAFNPVWKSTSELGYPEKYCVDLREPPRHRADAATGTTSRRWRGNSTPFSRRSYREDVASMAWGARNLNATQVQSALPRRLPLREGLPGRRDAGHARRGLLPGPRRARGRAGRGEGAE